jgi:hypothetical protein
MIAILYSFLILPALTELRKPPAEILYPVQFVLIGRQNISSIICHNNVLPFQIWGEMASPLIFSPFIKAAA